jgi:hypothetical protein
VEGVSRVLCSSFGVLADLSSSDMRMWVVEHAAVRLREPRTLVEPYLH